MRCSLNHEYGDAEPECPLCGEKNPTLAAPEPEPPPVEAPPALEPEAQPGAPSGFQRPAEEAPPPTPVEPIPIRPTLPATPAAAEPTPGLALQQALTSDLPTIAIIGSYDVGKSFLIERLDRIAFKKGYHPEGTFHDTEGEGSAPVLPARAEPVPIERAKGRKAAAPKPKRTLVPMGAKVIELTRNIHLYEYTIREGGRDFRIVDIPGEYFFQLMKPDEADQSINVYRLDAMEVRKLWEVLARTDGLILLVPATELALPPAAPGGGTEIDVAARAIQPLRKACQLLEVELAAHNDDLARAIAAIQAMGPAERQKALQADRRACDKPLLILYSKADEVVGAPPSEANPAGRRPVPGAEFADIDPALYSARKSDGLIAQLRQGFTTFKIDFVTAYAGLPRDSKSPDHRLPSFGVWDALQWVLGRTPRGRRRRLAAPAWFASSGWVVKFRALVDADFRRSL